MAHKLFIGNLDYNVDDNDLSELFSQHGEVVSAKVIKDRESGRSKGFGFVELSSSEEAADAKAKLHDHELNGRAIKIDDAKPQQRNNDLGSW